VAQTLARSTPRARRPTPDAAHEILPTRLARTLRPNATHHHIPLGDPTLSRTTRARRPTTTPQPRASRDRNPKRIATTTPSTAPVRRPHARARDQTTTRDVRHHPIASPHPCATSPVRRARRTTAPVRARTQSPNAHRASHHRPRRASREHDVDQKTLVLER